MLGIFWCGLLRGVARFLVNHVMILQRPHYSTSLICYFSSGKRWEKVKVPNTGSYVSVTAKVVGRTTREPSCCLHPGHVLHSKILLHSRIFTGFDPVNFVKATKQLEWLRRISNIFKEDPLFRS